MPSSNPIMAFRIIRAFLVVIVVAVMASSCGGLPTASSPSTKPRPSVPTSSSPNTASDRSALPPELAELSRMLRAPLPAPAADVRGLIELPKDYPVNRALALNRLNQYRAAAGLTLYVYDPALTAMGQAHAEYLLANAAAKMLVGHFEIASNKYYSKGGDEAARTSGICPGAADPLSALDGLMSMTFHRMQFLRPEETRVGLGFAYDPASGGGGVLFVTRKAEGGKAISIHLPRFIVFPPDGFDDALSTFGAGEFPDPRPGVRQGDPPTGYPITISLDWDDVKSFENAEVDVTNARGESVPVWLSYPGNPAVASPDMRIYSGDAASISQAYRDNFNAVFILPKEPLEQGSSYTVRAALRIAGKTEKLSWVFKTRGARLWTVQPNPADPRQDLDFAFKNASKGDTIKLAAGEYLLRTEINLSKPIRIIGEPRRTILRYSGNKDLAALAFSAAAVLQGIDFSGAVSMHLGRSACLLLEDCRFSYAVQEASLAGCERGSSLTVERCDFAAYASPVLAYFLDQPADAATASLYIGVGNIFGAPGWDGKHSYGSGLERELSHLLN